MSHSLIQVPHSLVLLNGFFTCYQGTHKKYNVKLKTTEAISLQLLEQVLIMTNLLEAPEELPIIFVQSQDSTGTTKASRHQLVAMITSPVAWKLLPIILRAQACHSPPSSPPPSPLLFPYLPALPSHSPGDKAFYQWNWNDKNTTFS